MENRVSTCHIVVDSLYGSLKLVQELKSIGIDTVAKCRADRPAWIFATNVKKLNEVHKTPCVGQWASMGGELPGGNQILRLHYSCEPPRKGPHIYAHLISTVHSPTDHGCLKEAISRGVEEKNGERHTEEAMLEQMPVLECFQHTTRLLDILIVSTLALLVPYRHSGGQGGSPNSLFSYSSACALMLIDWKICIMSNFYALYKKMIQTSTSRKFVENNHPGIAALSRPWKEYRSNLKNILYAFPDFVRTGRHELKNTAQNPRFRANEISRVHTCAFCVQRYRDAKRTPQKSNRMSQYCETCSAPICKDCARAPGLRMSCGDITAVQLCKRRRIFDGAPTLIFDKSEETRVVHAEVSPHPSATEGSTPTL